MGETELFKEKSNFVGRRVWKCKFNVFFFSSSSYSFVSNGWWFAESFSLQLSHWMWRVDLWTSLTIFCNCATAWNNRNFTINGNGHWKWIRIQYFLMIIVDWFVKSSSISSFSVNWRKLITAIIFIFCIKRSIWIDPFNNFYVIGYKWWYVTF